ncbi:hypothetical protein F350042L8_34780 [Fusobacterium ulcerans]|jgi:hypothetical protein|uniref:hypothetical protein n=1 Tax=Fusobacterium ulcerans TaxID=861 RepID=UPI0034A75727
MKINYKNFLLKTFIPSIFLYTLFRFFSFKSLGYFYPLDSGDIFLFVVLTIGIHIFWALLDYFQEVTGMVMKENWIGRIIFILGVLAMIYLYKINGRI